MSHVQSCTGPLATLLFTQAGRAGGLCSSHFVLCRDKPFGQEDPNRSQGDWRKPGVAAWWKCRALGKEQGIPFDIG